MNLPELCVRRPVFATMLVLLPVVFGLISYRDIGVDLMPNVDLPIVTVSVTRAGTSVAEMETSVTEVLEDAVNTIAGIDELRSTTKEGVSYVNIQFLLEKNRDVAYQEVTGKIQAALSRLPTGTDAPVIDKFDIDAAPVLTIALSGKRSLREVTDFADREIRDALSSLPGVGAVNRAGGRKRAIQVTVDARKLEARDLTIDDVRQALVRENLELPGGRVDQPGREPTLRTIGRIADARGFERIVVSDQNGIPVRIEDVGRAEDSVEEPRADGRLDGDPAVLLVVQKQSGSNTVAVIDAVKAKLDQLRDGFAQSGKGDLRLQVIRDQSVFINGSLHEIQKHLLIGAALVSATILLFLRDWRTMMIASLSIPTSLIATFAAMRWLGFTLNNITMLALVMAVGVVIDDAVVVHENIFRWMEEKRKSAWDAALGATNEIAMAVMATTLSLIVIFLPIAFMSGRVGRFFHSFGITMAVAILISMLVSFTLTPMLAARFLKLPPKGHGGGPHGSGGVYGAVVERPYLAALRWALRRRWTVLALAALVTATLFPLPLGRWLAFGDDARAKRLAFLDYPGLVELVGLDFIPTEDQSEFEIAISTPAGWPLARVSDSFATIEREVHAWPQVVHTLTMIGDTSGRLKAQGDPTTGSIYVKLLELEDRKPDAKGHVFSQFDMMKQARALVARWPDLRVGVQPATGGGGGRSADIEYTMVGPDLERLYGYADGMLAALRRDPDLVDVDTTLALRKPEIRVIVDRERAADRGIGLRTIASTLRTLVGGEIVGDFRDESRGQLYDVWLRAAGIDRGDRDAVGRLTIPGADHVATRLDAIATLEPARGPAQIDHFARTRKITLIANTNGIPISEATKRFEAAAAKLGMPADYRLIPSGRAKTQAEANTGFLLAFGLSLVFMYMILAAQFESFTLPVTILLAVPITIPFALVSLLMLRQPLTIYSTLGVFLLFGIVKKNGILQVDYTNVLRAQAAADPAAVPADYRDADAARGGWWRWVARLDPARRTRAWAIVEANRVRLRPILMTTLMLIASMVPIALGTGPGSGRRSSMAKVIVGGQALSLLLSLLVTPVGYALFDDVQRRLTRRKKAEPALREPTTTAPGDASVGGADPAMKESTTPA